METKNKKGQVEIIGLAILVVILVVILVIALNFNFKTTDNKSDLRKSLVANNLLNALIKQQGNVNIRELINDCYIEKRRNVNNGLGCLNLKKELNNVFSTILINRDYFIKLRTEELEFFSEGNCDKGIESTTYRFKEEGILFIANLRIC
ncbi:hypothetical protein J4449_01995 [Candidatus Woesearchaeota archaeon]|nr:hypothetical protein [Candidatus Woesearchaeota archaeon]